MARRLLPYGILLLLLAAMVPLKAGFEFGLGPRAHDADYYYGIARHVAEGEGLRSNISLYFQGFKSFPHRVTQSPVWPLTLGAAGRVFGIDAVAHRLPVLLYFVDLILLYFLALRLWKRVAGGRPGWIFRGSWGIDFGHVAVFLFATNIRFFRFTSVPNNEALTFLWLFSALLVLDRAAEQRSVSGSFVAGLLSSLALLTRVQALTAAFVIPVVLLALGLADKRARRLAPAAVGGAILPLIPWMIHLSTWMDGVTIQAMLGFETQSDTPELGVFRHTVAIPTIWGTLLDRLSGLGVAFDPRSSQSYVHHFSAAAYALPLAALRLGWGWGTGARPHSLRLSAEQVLPLAMVTLGVGMLLPVHLSHMALSKEWLFGFRHGLPLLLLILPALAYLDAHTGKVCRGVTGALLIATLVMNVLAMRTLLEKHFRTGIGPYERQLVEWLDAQAPLPSVVTVQPWELATYSRSGYHWILCQSDPRQTLRLLRKAGADYVVVFRKERPCRFVDGLLPRFLRIEKIFGDNQIYVLAPSYEAPSRAPEDAATGAAEGRAAR